VIAIISADIKDTLVRRQDELVRKKDMLVQEEAETARRNTWLMAVTVAVVMLGMGTLLFLLMRQVKVMQDKLARMAHYDPVTGLPNRQYLIDHLESSKAADSKTPYALFFTDLDNFKTVNDKAGHDAGDALLKRIGAFLMKVPGLDDRKNTRIFRPAAGRLNVTARIGGDEFVMLVPDVGCREEAAHIAETIIESFHRHVTDEHVTKYGVSLSIGAALYPSQSEEYHVILKYADIAMYHAKRAGKNGYRIYDHEMPEKREKTEEG
jgi:diguanylate cyclase (GGDEF)-like protein